MAASQTTKSSLPLTEEEWRKMAAEKSVDQLSLHGAPSQSGSKMGIQQFLLLRAVWRRRRNIYDLKTGFSNGEWIDKETYKDACRSLDRLNSWKTYLNSFTPDHKRDPREGTFTLARHYQRLSTKGEEPTGDTDSKVEFSPRMTRNRAAQLDRQHRQTTPTPTPSGESKDAEYVAQLIGDMDINAEQPPRSSSSSSSSTSFDPQAIMSPIAGENARNFRAIQDEQIVNTALILFLNALTLHVPQVTGQWSLYRQPFILRNRLGEKMFEARVDGIFVAGRQGNDVKAIVEVKPFLRSDRIDSIRMQETAQMAAWIYQHKPTEQRRTYSRAIISQDRHEIYVTAAQFDDDYINYISERELKQPTKPPFLIMQEYGPFYIGDETHMKMLGRMLLGLSMHLSL